MPNTETITMLVKKRQNQILSKGTVLAEASICWHKHIYPYKGFDQQSADNQSLHPSITPPHTLTETVILEHVYDDEYHRRKFYTLFYRPW